MYNRPSNRSSERGMTIVEVLMVVFIIGLAAGIVTLTIPQRPTEEQAGAQAFARVLREAQDQAILSGQPIGLKLSENGYALLQWRRERWVPHGRAVALPRQLEVVEQEELIVDQQLPANWPDLVFDPTGIVEMAEFQLRGRGIRIDVTINETGEVILVER
ncbi:MAG: GspH/FimT family pseudopilin [Pseudomonadota bacterium]